jgi:hypothetical protein
MCFSAAASFTASAVLATGGVFSVNKVSDIRYMPLALIPFIFAFQQFCEGIVWMSFRYHGLLNFRQTFGFMYLIIAQTVWPIFVPFSIWLIEQKNVRRHMLFFLLCLGIVIGIYLGFQISSFTSTISVSKHHLIYVPEKGRIHPFNNGLLYFLATVPPPFISSVRRMRAFGFLVLTSFALSVLFFPEAVISVWCYFAALLSLIIYLVIQKPKWTLRQSKI